MPQIGLCANTTCNKELTQLYECHCCNCFICLNHLLEHVDKSKRTQERFDLLRNELITVLSVLKTIVEKKSHELERDKQLINQGTTMLDMNVHSIDEIQRVFGEIKQVVATYHKDETIFKVEPFLTDVNTCTYSNETSCENNNRKSFMSKQHSPSDEILQRPKSPVYVAVRTHRNENEEPTTIRNNECLTDVDVGFIDDILDDQAVDFTKDEADDEEENELLSFSPRIYVDRCQIPFDDSVSSTKAQHSIPLCSKDNTDNLHLRDHSKHQQESKETHAQRLFQEITKGQRSRATTLFNEDGIIFGSGRTFPCPLSVGMVDLFGYCPKSAKRVPCKSRTVIGQSLVVHLTQFHRIPYRGSRRFAQNYTEYLTEILFFGNNNANSC